MAIKFIPRAEQVRQGLDHVYYEIEQLTVLLNLQTLTFVTAENDPTLARTLDNAKFEAMLLHSRALLDFFETGTNERFRDSILCEDYGFVARAVNIPRDYRERINKELAHLTYSRPGLNAVNRTWEIRLLILPILNRSKEFCDHLISKFPQGDAVIPEDAWHVLRQGLANLLNQIQQNAAMK